MAKIVVVSILGIMALGTIDLKRGDHGTLNPLGGERGEAITPIQPPGQRDSSRNLLLSALGTGRAEPGQVRIPVPVEGDLYEVIIAKPGFPKSVAIARTLSNRGR